MRATLLMFIVGALWATAAQAETANATLRDQRGRIVGRAQLEEGPRGLLIRARLFGVPPGVHAFHLHEVGACRPPFDSAGGHFNPRGRSHGFMNPHGAHAGDLPNVIVARSGEVRVEELVPQVTLHEGPNALLNADGAALVLHAKADDYKTDPTGDAGGRWACGVVR